MRGWDRWFYSQRQGFRIWSSETDLVWVVPINDPTCLIFLYQKSNEFVFHSVSRSKNIMWDLLQQNYIQWVPGLDFYHSASAGNLRQSQVKVFQKLSFPVSNTTQDCSVTLAASVFFVYASCCHHFGRDSSVMHDTAAYSHNKLQQWGVECCRVKVD